VYSAYSELSKLPVSDHLAAMVCSVAALLTVGLAGLSKHNNASFAGSEARSMDHNGFARAAEGPWLVS
jgi:hypothetical protein